MVERIKPAPKANEAKRIKITESMLLQALKVTKPRPPLFFGKAKEDIFKPYQPPPGVLPKNTAVMAMDDAQGAAWATTGLGFPSFGWGYGGSNWDGFLGYPELSVLAQRPEYRRISEIIAQECTRKFIDFESTSETKAARKKIKKLHDACKKFKLRSVINKMISTDGFFGRSHMYIDTGATKDPKELKTPIGNGRDELSKSKVIKGKLRRFGIIEPIWTYPSQYESADPLEPNWYKPDSWFVMGKELHISRIPTLISREVPDILKPAYNFGGLSLSQMCMPYVNNWLQTRQSVNAIINAFSVFVLGTNLQSSLQADGDQVFARAQLFNLLRDNRGLMMIDKDSESFENVAAPLGSLDALQAQALEHQCYPAGIPIIKLFGDQPAGLNASSEGVIRTFYDNINAYQEFAIRDHIETAVGFIQLSEFGEIDPDITIKFVPLWALDEKSEAERRKLEADIHSVYIEAGVVSQEEVREVLADEPDSPFAHLDPADVPELPETIEGKPFHAREMVGAGSEPVDQENPNKGGKVKRIPREKDEEE